MWSLFVVCVDLFDKIASDDKLLLIHFQLQKYEVFVMQFAGDLTVSVICFSNILKSIK